MKYDITDTILFCCLLAHAPACSHKKTKYLLDGDLDEADGGEVPADAASTDGSDVDAEGPEGAEAKGDAPVEA